MDLLSMLNGFSFDPHKTLIFYRELLSHDRPQEIPVGLILSKYDDVNFVLRSKDVGRNYEFGMEFIHGEDIKEQYFFKIMQDWLVEVNPPRHTRLRKLMQRPFSSANIDKLARDVEQICDALIEKIQTKKDFDLVKDYSFPLPVLVICRMLGIPSKDYDWFLNEPVVPPQIVDPVRFTSQFMEETNRRFYWLRDYFGALFYERKKKPQDDIISLLVSEMEDGDSLSEDELLSNVILLFFAGHETTASLVAAGLRELFLHPSQLDLLKSDFSLMDNAVSEMLRMISVAQMTVYSALRDIDINGVTLKENMGAFCLIGAANRDPRVFPDPDRMDISRDNAKKALAFGAGIHYCLGAHLARLEAKIAINKLLLAFPSLILHELDKPNWRKSLSLRALGSQPASVK